MSNRLIQIKNKARYLQQNILNMLCVSLLGFLSGNLFGTILNSLRKFLVWDGFIIASLIIVIEIISYFSYKPIRYNEISTQSNQDPSFYKSKICSPTRRTSTNQRFVRRFVPQQSFCTKGALKKNILYTKPWSCKRMDCKKVHSKNIFKNFNLFKIGVMIGFFVDAFKVGS